MSGQWSEAAKAWAASGAMALTGPADGPAMLAPDGVIDAIAGLGRPLPIDGLGALGWRAAIAGLGRRGQSSCGGSGRLLRAAEGWIAASLPRPDDISAVPAWLGIDASSDDVWPAVEKRIRELGTREVVDQGRLLGLAVVELGERSPGPLVGATRVGDAPPLARPPVVIDLTSLWAGPLCSRLLADEGARVVKVESSTRPDGARHGPPAFFDLLHHGKESVALDLASESGVDTLIALLRAADVVVEGSRPRALEQLGIMAADVAARGPRVWLSITAHGRDGPGRDRVGFGDDTAVAGGLVAWHEERPLFVADAVADPLTGVVAAAAIGEALAGGGRWLLAADLAGVAAHVAAAADGPWVPCDPAVAAPPAAPARPGRAPHLGEHTDRVLADGLG